MSFIALRNAPNINILEINITQILDKLRKERNIKLFSKNINKDETDWLKFTVLRC